MEKCISINDYNESWHIFSSLKSWYRCVILVDIERGALLAVMWVIQFLSMYFFYIQKVKVGLESIIEYFVYFLKIILFVVSEKHNTKN